MSHRSNVAADVGVMQGRGRLKHVFGIDAAMTNVQVMLDDNISASTNIIVFRDQH